MQKIAAMNLKKSNAKYIEIWHVTWKEKNLYILKERQCRIYMYVPYMYIFYKKEAKATHISSAIKNSL